MHYCRLRLWNRTKFVHWRYLYNMFGRLLDNSRIPQLADCQLAEWTTRGLVNSRTGQLADAAGDFACLVFVLLATSRDRELSRPRLVHPRVGNPRVGVSASCPVTKRYNGYHVSLRRHHSIQRNSSSSHLVSNLRSFWKAVSTRREPDVQ